MREVVEFGRAGRTHASFGWWRPTHAGAVVLETPDVGHVLDDDPDHDNALAHVDEAQQRLASS